MLRILYLYNKIADLPVLGHTIPFERVFAMRKFSNIRLVEYASNRCSTNRTNVREQVFRTNVREQVFRTNVRLSWNNYTMLTFDRSNRREANNGETGRN